jgi:hypothetical protein
MLMMLGWMSLIIGLIIALASLGTVSGQDDFTTLQNICPVKFEGIRAITF